MLEHCHTIDDLRELSRRTLPAPIFNMMDGGSETEITLRRNTQAFDDVKLVPNALVDVGRVNTATRVLGHDMEWPVFCSPTGGTRAMHMDGELAVVRAAAKTGTMYGLSSCSTTSIEDVAAASTGPKLFQLYILKDRELTWTLIERAKRAGYGSMCVTVDTAVIGQWERDLKSRLRGPKRQWPLSTMLGFARHPGWGLRRLVKPLIMPTFIRPDGSSMLKGSFVDALDPSITWKDIREVADRWGGPLSIKGLMSVDDARRAADAGATAVTVSNHGGRTLDGAAATIETLPRIVDAVGDRLEVILDGGVRRGVHVLKALAYGAKACSIGRPYLYGVSAGGEAGVVKALTILRTELVRSMQLAGCPDLASIDRRLIHS